MIRAMGMITCEDALARLWEFIDGELSLEERDEVRRHLEVCHRCYPHYDFQRAYRRYVRRLGEGERVSEDCRRRLFEALLEEEGADQGGA